MHEQFDHTGAVVSHCFHQKFADGYEVLISLEMLGMTDEEMSALLERMKPEEIAYLRDLVRTVTIRLIQMPHQGRC